MGIWKAALKDFNTQCDAISECDFCALAPCDCSKFKKALEDLARNEEELEANDEKQ